MSAIDNTQKFLFITLIPIHWYHEYIYFISIDFLKLFCIYIHIYITQQRDIYEAVIFRFLQIWSVRRRFVRIEI